MCVDTVEHHYNSAFWDGLVIELEKLGLVQQLESVSGDIPEFRLTQTGVDELAALNGREKTRAGTCTQGIPPDHGDSVGLRSTRLQCSRSLVQILFQPCGRTVQSHARMLKKVMP